MNATHAEASGECDRRAAAIVTALLNGDADGLGELVASGLAEDAEGLVLALGRLAGELSLIGSGETA